jgi:hypothetical protein
MTPDIISSTDALSTDGTVSQNENIVVPFQSVEQALVAVFSFPKSWHELSEN